MFDFLRKKEFRLRMTKLYKKRNIKWNHQLCFWDLHKVINEEDVVDIITHFYTSIFKDNSKSNQWFIEEFKTTGDLEHHIHRQALFWLVLFNFKEYKYKGGIKKLNKHHYLVSNVMTSKGAELWLIFMDKTLETFKKEKRINPKVHDCIRDFTRFFMHIYAIKFNFKFNYTVKSKL